MTSIRESSWDEYARHFWNRQKEKGDPRDREALAAIGGGANPVEWLAKPETAGKGGYPYKLPHECNQAMRVARLGRRDIEDLLIHDYMPSGKWMRDRGLVPDPYTRNLKALAELVLSRGYFSREARDTQQRLYQQWKHAGSLDGVIADESKVLIESAGFGTFEIVDGWGRLLPFVALLREGYIFHTVESFVATTE